MADFVNAIVAAPMPYSARLLGSRSAAASPAAQGPPSTAPAVRSARPAVDIEMQQALQTARVSTQLFSTLMTPEGRFLRPPASAPGQGHGGFMAMSSPSSGSWQARASWQAAGSAGWASPRGGAGNGNSLAAIRAAEDIIQAASAGPPTAEGRRIAAEAFLMEAQAQRDFMSQQAQGMAGRRQWMA
jgi:hypothetical protein